MISPKQLRELINYDPQTGVLTRRVYMGSNAPAGSVLHAHNGRGYGRTTIKGVAYLHSRLAWAHAHGSWPVGSIDHIDGNTANNKAENLRDVSHRVNCQNRQKPNANNLVGYLGVSWNTQKQKWKSTISLDRTYKHLGFYPTPELAHEAYLKAKRELHEGCTI